MHQYAFVTIVFGAELELLLLQARSMSLYLNPTIVSEIVVINNDSRPLGQSQISKIKEEYGPLKSLVRFYQAKEICNVPLTKGWRSQQVQKFAVANYIKSDRYVVLDAKTHLINNLDIRFLEDESGRPTVNVYSYIDHPLYDVLNYVLKYLGVNPEEHALQFTATVTPFIFDTNLVRDMMIDIEQKSGRSFPDEFVVQELTEFFLYSGWLLSKGIKLEDFFHFHQRFCQIVWGHLFSVDDCKFAIRVASDGAEPFFSVHRKAIARFDLPQHVLISKFWFDQKLFASHNEALEFITSFQKKLNKYQKFDRIRSLPAQMITVLRRMTVKKIQR